MGGHGTVVGGVIIDCGTFNWGEAVDRFPKMLQKDGPMSFSYWKAFGNIAFAMSLRLDILMEVGSILNPASAQQLLIGMETLSLRCERHATNTMAVARYLESHPRVAWVNYPGEYSVCGYVLRTIVTDIKPYRPREQPVPCECEEIPQEGLWRCTLLWPQRWRCGKQDAAELCQDYIPPDEVSPPYLGSTQTSS